MNISTNLKLVIFTNPLIFKRGGYPCAILKRTYAKCWTVAIVGFLLIWLVEGLQTIVF
jgi:hypothetical protein